MTDKQIENRLHTIMGKLIDVQSAANGKIDVAEAMRDVRRALNKIQDPVY